MLSKFVPSVELEHEWSFDRKEILARFDLMERFDPVVRIFGEKEQKKEKSGNLKTDWTDVGRTPNEEALDILVRKGRRDCTKT